MPLERRSTLVSPGQLVSVQESEGASRFVKGLPIWRSVAVDAESRREAW